ncbi:S8 family serine peptidase [Haladaptatus caseinilyticus]|uniref:S8 family serine peptidase n=1 Tax=Haladaptatus caseinilyticus TaxID=2993314 RepID=UPI00224B6E50|nr:S8 family serine peptidase [Haladaptatus caseinilyticus]
MTENQLSRRNVLKATGVLGATAVAPWTTSAATVDDALDTSGGLQEVLVVFETNDDVDHLRRLNLAEGYYKFSVLPIGYSLLTGGQIETVASWSDVRAVQKNVELEYHNDDARETTGVSTVQEERFYTGESVHAVAIDSGVDGDHPDLENNLQHNFRFVDPLDRETMWVDAGPADTASMGHGTHVSGSIAGDGTKSDGAYRGMAPDADLTVYSTDAVAALLQVVGAYDDMIDRQRAGKHDVQVVNNSYGPSSGNDADYNPNGALEVATWMAFEEGILPVFSAGNSGPDTNTLSNYAKGPHILASAATDDHMTVTDFSSRGRKPGYDGGGEGAQYDREAAYANLRDLYAKGYENRPVVGETTYSGTVGPGVTDSTTGVSAGESVYEEWVAPDDAGYVEITVSWTPQGEDVDVYLHEGAEDGPVVASGASLNNPEELAGTISPGTTYYLELKPYTVVVADYSADVTARKALPAGERPSGPYGLYRTSVGTPGDLVMSTLAPDDPLQTYPTGFAGRPEQQGTDVWYGRLSGTSMSGPVLAGIVALVYDAYYQTHGEFPDPMDAINLVEATAHDARDDHAPWNIGAGFADADAAVALAESGDVPSFDDVSLAVDGKTTDPVFTADGTRADDGSTFTAGQTNRVDVTVDSASEQVAVRDRVPFDWDVVGGDAHTVYTDDGARYVEFTDPASVGETRTYFIEAPDSTGQYEFGPAEARPADAGAFRTLTGSEANTVVGEQT